MASGKTAAMQKNARRKPHATADDVLANAWVRDLSMAVAILTEDNGGFRVSVASQGFCEIIGLDPALTAGGRLDELLPEDAIVNLTRAMHRALRDNTAVGALLAGRLEIEAGARLGFVARPAAGINGGVSLEVRRLEGAFAGRQRDALFDQLRLINGGVTYLYDLVENQQFDFSDLLGYPAGHPAMRGRAILQLFHPDDRPRVTAHRRRLSALRDGAFSVVAARMRHSDGGWRWIEARERVFGRNRDGGVRRILGFASDVTDRHRLIESLAATSRALLTAEAQERRRIARELHDSVAQHLVAIDLTLSRLERRRRKEDVDQGEMIVDIREALGAAHREVRTFSYLLHPPDLERLGLETTLRKFLEGFGMRSGLDVTLSVAGATPAIEPVVELALFRVAQEALMNVHKHAGASLVDIDLRYEPGNVVLEVRDDGVGLQSSDVVRLMSEDSGGVGIAAMKARMDQIGGAVELLPLRKGLLVRAMAPLNVAGDGMSLDAQL